MTDFDRRQILKGGGAALTLGLAGCLSDGRGVPGRSPPVEDDGEDGNGGPNGPNFQSQIDEHLADVSNYDGTVEDLRDEGDLDVVCGDVEGVEEQPYAFGPSAVQIEPGTTITWTWSGSAGHSVTHDNGDAFNSGILSGDGTTFEYTFDQEGLFLYICIPHEQLGQKGAVVVGDIGGDGGTDQEPSNGEDQFQAEIDDHLSDTGNYDGTVADFTGDDTVDVTNGDVEGVEQPFAFGPPAIEIDAGTTVRWTWSGSDSHSVTHDNGDAFNSEIQSGDGTTFEYTFDEPGLYLYICIPHESLGQKGAIVVRDSGGNGGDGDDGDGGGVPQEVSAHLSDVANFDGTIADFTGQGAVDVTSGDVEGVEEQPYAFGPPAIRVSQGTEVTWTWSGSAGHSVTHDNGDAFDSGIQSGDGTTFSYTFDESGVYLYICIPHEALGQKGAVIVE
ncbi:MAG: halocyanin domain-containing protein [Halovenus sp.]